MHKELALEQFPETRVSLILRLAEPQDVAAWQEFVAIYAPVIFAYAKKKGLQPADAEDLTQETLFGVARAIDRFRPDAHRAMFRTWLSRIARNLIADHFTGHAKRPIALSMSDSWLQVEGGNLRAGDAIELEPDFDMEYRQSLFRFAANRVRERVSAATWEAFKATSIDGLPAQAVAQRLSMSLGSLYVARCRVLKMLRSEVTLHSDVEQIADEMENQL